MFDEVSIQTSETESLEFEVAVPHRIATVNTTRYKVGSRTDTRCSRSEWVILVDLVGTTCPISHLVAHGDRKCIIFRFVRSLLPIFVRSFPVLTPSFVLFRDSFRSNFYDRSRFTLTSPLFNSIFVVLEFRHSTP